MTGIRERRFWPSSHLPSQASAEAGRKLLENGIGSKQIDMLVHSSVCRDRLEPATASYVHKELQLGPDTQIMDVSNACLGFINSVVLVAGMIESKQIKTCPRSRRRKWETPHRPDNHAPKRRYA